MAIADVLQTVKIGLRDVEQPFADATGQLFDRAAMIAIRNHGGDVHTIDSFHLVKTLGNHQPDLTYALDSREKPLLVLLTDRSWEFCPHSYSENRAGSGAQPMCSHPSSERVLSITSRQVNNHRSQPTGIRDVNCP